MMITCKYNFAKSCLPTVWPDLVKFHHFGKTLKVFGYSFRGYFVLGKILNLIGKIFMIFDIFWLMFMAQCWKDNLAIWSQCSPTSTWGSVWPDYWLIFGCLSTIMNICPIAVCRFNILTLETLKNTKTFAKVAKFHPIWSHLFNNPFHIGHSKFDSATGLGYKNLNLPHNSHKNKIMAGLSMIIE